MTDECPGPASIDVTSFLEDRDGELARCAQQHWWAQTVDGAGRSTAVVLSWEGARAALTDRRLSPRSFPDDMAANGLSPETVAQITPLFSRHGEEHRRLRAVLTTAFTPKKVESLRPDARAVADRLADQVAEAGGECEIVAAFAEPLPPEVFAILFGLPVEDRDRMARWSTDIGLAFSPSMSSDAVARVEAAAADLRAYALERIAASRAVPGDDLVTRLVEAEVDGQRLPEDDVVAMITGFVFAGSETTRRQLTAGVQLFAEHPAAWERLAADHDLVPAAVEEVLRHRGIISGLTRRAESDFDRDDLEVAEGGRLLLSFDAANRDPSRFEVPERFVPDRSDASAHLTFGWGSHLCVGAGLARIELVEGLRALMARFGPPEVVEAGPSTGIGAPDWLQVRFPVRR